MSFANTLRKTVQKHGGMIFEGFDDAPEKWCSTGNYAMNRLLSGNYYWGFPFGKTVAVAGESGSGKSLVAATGAYHAQKEHGALVVWVDVEYASKEEWLARLGVDTSPENFIYVNASTIADCKKLLSDIVKIMRPVKPEHRQPVYMVIDSYGMLLTEKELEEAEAGDLVGDQGQHAKQVKNLIKAATALIGRLPICVVGMAHSMASTDKYNPDDVITGGRGLQYAASLVLLFNKLKMKADQLEDQSILDGDEDNKEVVGIRCKAQVHKSRFAKPFEKVFVQIPYPRGIDAYSGLLDLMVSLGEVYQPSVGWFAYSTKLGSEVKFRRKEFREVADTAMKLAMEGNLRIGAPVPEAQTEPALAQ